MAVPMEQRYTAEDYFAMNSEGRCELIDGYIVDMSPSPNQNHQWLQGNLHTVIMNYIRSNGGKCRPYTTSDVKLNDDTVVVPDIYVTCRPEKLDGQKHLGAPDWVIEIVSPFNLSNDYVTKLNLYGKYGVREYWIVDPIKNIVTVYIWEGSLKDFQHYTFNDTIPVHIFKDNTPPLGIRISDFLD